MSTIDLKKLEELKKALTPEQYDICFRGGTEVPFTGEYTDMDDKGTYSCVVCDSPLFLSKTKFHSSSGWPSFWAPIKGALDEHDDRTLGMTRTEVRCATCGAGLEIEEAWVPDAPMDSRRYCRDHAGDDAIRLKDMMQPG